ncbi:MAG: SAM-dependent methyltransferase [Oscillospiraceae bacterium]|nr:SAM-dependent methyltransferase [Oscillospiraceae bacterium]
MIPLDNRLKTAFELCRPGLISADVGTDHARLAAALALEKSVKVYASDINDGPLEAARRTIEEYGVKNVELVKSNGLENIPYADDVIICGMGGELISGIVEKCRFTNESTRFILQPMTKADFLRRRLYGLGFELMEERAAEHAGKIYTVMLWMFSGVSREISETEALCGKNRDRKYLEGIAAKLIKNAANMEKSAGCSGEAARLRETAKEIKRIAENED